VIGSPGDSTRRAAPRFRLLAISDRQGLPGTGEALAEWIRHLALAGVDALQLREKDLDDRALWSLARRARTLLPPPACLLVNGRLDVALAAGVDGAHLPADGVPLRALRERFGPGVLLGRSTHCPEEVEQALRDGADYVVFGPVYPTPGKPGPPAGLTGLREAAAAGLPVYALGGITLERLGEVAEAGAAGAAGIRAFQPGAGTGSLTALVQAAAVAFPRPPCSNESAAGRETSDP
jgi:thiamine-phosphate pyrophosphorylase